MTFKKFDEVIERANTNDLGLCSYIYTNNLEKAHKASELMETGCELLTHLMWQLLKHRLVELNRPAMEERIKNNGNPKDYLNIKYTHLGIYK